MAMNRRILLRRDSKIKKQNKKSFPTGKPEHFYGKEVEELVVYDSGMVTDPV